MFMTTWRARDLSPDVALSPSTATVIQSSSPSRPSPACRVSAFNYFLVILAWRRCLVILAPHALSAPRVAFPRIGTGSS